VAPGNHVLDGALIPHGNGQFLLVVRPIEKIASHCRGVRSKNISDGVSATAAANCIVPDRPV